MSWVIDNSRHKGSSFVVLLMIANCADRDGQNAYPGFEKLARDSRITIRQITNIIPILERSGEVIVERGKGPHGTNRYTLNMQQSRLPLEKIANGKMQAVNFQRSVRNQKIEPTTPLPPASGGIEKTSPSQETFFEWRGQWIAVQLERHKRILSRSEIGSLSGARAEDVVARLRAKGYEARLVPEAEVATWPDRVVA